MKIHRIDHVGIIVDDLSAAKAFFLDFGLELKGEADLEGELVDQVTGLNGVKSTIVMLGPPDGQTCIELTKFHTPSDEKGVQHALPNALGIRHIAFAVEDIETLLAKLEKKGMKPFNAIQNYKGVYKLCYLRGPEGIILELAEEIE